MTNASEFGRTPLINFDRGRKRASAGSPLTPEMKEFVDRVLVPILLKEYLAGIDPEIELAKEDSGASNSETAVRLLRQLRRP
jgi:hypothetical protein